MPTAHSCQALYRTERTEQREFTNEMSNRAHESPQVTNNGKFRATQGLLCSTFRLALLIMKGN